jgi:hypothetical protein
MPAFARKSPETDKGKKPSKPKSIKHSADKYPSLPGVEGTPTRPARFTARGTPPETDYREER